MHQPSYSTAPQGAGGEGWPGGAANLVSIGSKYRDATQVQNTMILNGTSFWRSSRGKHDVAVSSGDAIIAYTLR